MAAAPIRIHNEEEAWNAFLAAVEGSDVFDQADARIEFDGWPELHIKLRGEPFDSSITTEVMGGDSSTWRGNFGKRMRLPFGAGIPGI